MPVSSTIVTQYYTGIFRQAPSAAVSAAYQAMTDNNAALSSMLSAANLQVDPVVRMYQAAFNRLPDNAGMTAWVVPFSTGQITLASIANGFTQSTEFTTLYPASMSNAQYVGALYWNILQRQGEDAGIRGWVQALDSGALTRAQVLQGFSDSGEFTKNVLPAVNTFLTNIANTAVASQGSLSLYTGTLFDLGGGSSTVYNLTTAPETINATEANVTINGIVNSGTQANSTLTAADTINGGPGNATLSVTYLNGALADATNGALLSNIDTFNIRNTNAAATGVTLNANNVRGVTAVNSNLGTGDVTITNLAAGATVGIIGNGGIVNGVLTAGYATSTSAIVLNLTGGVAQTAAVGAVTFNSTASTATINSNGTVANVLGGIDFKGTGAAASLTSLTINANANLTTTDGAGTAEIVGWLAGGTANTITVNGIASSVNLGLLNTAVNVVNAAGLTNGGITATISAVAQVITGGAGNDTITTGGVQTGAVNAGAGTADRLIVAAAADVAATPGAKFTNFEILRNTAGGATLDVSNVVGITSIELGATGQGATNMSAAQAAAVTNLVDNATMTLALKDATGTSDVLSVTLANATATASADLTAATVTGFETMNVVSSSGSFADINSLGFAAAGNLTALNLSGAKPISVATANLTKAVAINGSALTAAGASATEYTLTISGNLIKGSSVVGSDQIDSITTTAAVAGTTGDYVTYSAGAGNDLIVSSIAAINNTGAGNASLKIDGGAGTDTLQVASGSLVDANFQYLTNLENLTFTGTTALNMVTGGFFDSNFKGNTTTAITAANQTGATVIDTTTFTGASKITITQDATSAATDTVTITNGVGADTVAVTFATVAFTTVNAISTGQGADSVTVQTNNALGAGGSITVNLGAGNDTATAVTGGAAAAATIWIGGTGADLITLQTTKAAVDTIGSGNNAGAVGQSIAATANTLATTIAVGNTLTFGSGVDRVVGFVSGSDQLDVTTAATAATNLVGVGSGVALANGTSYVAYGTYNVAAGSFTIAAAWAAGTATDAIIVQGDGTLNAGNTTGYVVLTGLNQALVAGDFA